MSVYNHDKPTAKNVNKIDTFGYISLNTHLNTLNHQAIQLYTYTNNFCTTNLHSTISSFNGFITNVFVNATLRRPNLNAILFHMNI